MDGSVHYLHILVICQYHPPDMGGGSKRVSNAISGLEKLGHTIEVVTAFPHYPHGKVPKEYRRKILIIENRSRKKVIRVWMPSIAHSGFFRRLLMYITFAITSLFALPVTQRPDVIWAANPNVFSSFPAVFFSIITRAPIVRNVDDLWPETAAHLGFLSKRKQKIGEAIAKMAYTLSKRITPISSAYSKVLIHKYGVNPDKIHTVEVGVDTDVFQANTSVDTSEDPHFDIVYSGLLGIAYDFETILEAAAELQNDSTIRFLIRGIGEMESSIRNRIIDLNLANVTLSSNYLERDDLIQLLLKADALLLPMTPNYYSDIGLPTKLLEYMACGRPILCISSGESARIVKEANCGIIVPPRDSSGLVTAILELKGNIFRNQLGKNGRKYSEEYFSLEKIAVKLEAAFHHAINE